MVKKQQQLILAKLVGLQMLGFIVLEVLFGLLVLIGVLPPTLILQQEGVIVADINTGYILIAGLMSVLVSGFWVALLVEVFDLSELKKFKL